MEQIFNIISDFLRGNPIFNTITLLLALLGIFSSWYFYRKSSRKRVPTFLVRTINLIEDKVQKIKSIRIRYLEKDIINLSITKFALWNGGKETINLSDIAKNNPLKICIDEKYEILDCEIIYQKNTSNDFTVSLSDNKKSIVINFDYFDYLEGVVIQIYHTGNSSSDLSLQGQVKSCKRINRKALIRSPLPMPESVISYMQKNDSKFKRQVISWAMFISGIGMFFYSIFLYFNDTEQIISHIQNHKNNTSLLIGVFSSFLYVIIGYRMIKKQIPKGFDIFNEEF